MHILKTTFALFFLIAFSQPAWAQTNETVRLIFSSNLEGQVTDCG